MDTLSILQSQGLSNASAIVAAAAHANTPLHIAAAFVEQETGGANIYGHDAGGLYPGEDVTEENYADFTRAVANGHTSNGVGPLQITYPGYFPDAESKGYQLWKPYDNICYGLSVINSLLAGHTLNQAAQLFNSGSTHGAPSYGASVEARAEKWSRLLSSHINAPIVTPSSPTTPTEKWPELTVDGIWGSQTTLALQSYLSTNPAYACAVDGILGPQTVKKLQAWLHVGQDGVFGPVTKRKLQGVLKVTQDGNFGPVSVKALQKFLDDRN